MVPENYHKEKIALWLLTPVYWLLVIWGINSFSEYREESLIADKNQDVYQAVSVAASRLEATVYESVYLSDSVATMITLNAQFVAENWQNVAGQLIHKSPYILSLAMSPDNVISHVYPLAGNEKALGLDYRDVPEQYATVMKAKALGGVYIDGPLELVQGGIALIARFPVFLDYPFNRDYWGSVSVVLDYERLLTDSGLPEITMADVAMKNADGVFYGRKETFQQPDAEVPVLLPNTRWQMALIHRTESLPSLKQERWLSYGLGGGAALILYLSILVLFRAYKLAHTAAMQDTLTKLPNRRYLMTSLYNKLRQCESEGGFALLSIDLNDFKAVNDTLGHDAGDALLQHVADQLRKAVRGSDIVSRVGGDEYLLILDRLTDAEKVQALIGKIQQQLEESQLHWKEEAVSPSLSIGYAIYRADQPLDAEQLLAKADRKMYREKTDRKAGDA